MIQAQTIETNLDYEASFSNEKENTIYKEKIDPKYENMLFFPKELDIIRLWNKQKFVDITPSNSKYKEIISYIKCKNPTMEYAENIVDIYDSTWTGNIILDKKLIDLIQTIVK